MTEADDSKNPPAVNLPPATRALVYINAAVFLAHFFLPESLFAALAYRPAHWLSPTIVTYMFLHEGWAHIAVNITSLAAFGAGVERIGGSRALLLGYFVSGIAGALVHAALNPGDPTPIVGASAAVSGLFAMLLPTVAGRSVKGMILAAVLWLAANAFLGFTGLPGSANPIAWQAHVGGFFAGLALVYGARTFFPPSPSEYDDET